MRKAFALEQSVCFLLGALLALLPFFVSQVPPLSDISNHVFVAKILANYHDPKLTFDHAYNVDWNFSSGDLAYLILIGLQKIFGPFHDVRAFLVLWLAALGTSVHLLARAISPSNNSYLAALISLPFAFSWFVWMGFLPFIMTWPLFCFGVAVWLKPMAPFSKCILLWLVLVALFLTHIVGFCAFLATLSLLAFLQQGRRVLGFLALVLAPVPILFAHYLVFSKTPHFALQYGGSVVQIYDLFQHTWGSLTNGGRLLMALWVSGILFSALFFVSKKKLAPELAAIALLLMVLGILIPLNMGGLWPAGSRLFPFALLLLLAAIPWSQMGERQMALMILLLLALLSGVTSKRVAAINQDQKQFLTLVEGINPGSRVLPIFADVMGGGESRMTWPWMAMDSAANILKGGSNPFTFATPHIISRATPLSYQNALGPEADTLFDPSKDPTVFVGASKRYDYVISWDLPKILRPVIEDEFKRIQGQGKAELWVPLGQNLKQRLTRPTQRSQLNPN